MQQQIRTDRTKYNPDKDSENWTNRMYKNDEMTNKEKVLQQDLVKSWQTMASSKNADELREYDIMRRVSAVTEGDTTEARVKQRRADFEREQRIAEKLLAKQKTGQSEEEFQDELDSFGAFYRNALKTA